MTAVTPARTQSGTVAATLTTGRGEAFVFATHPVPALDLTFEGIAGDEHAGHTRRSGGREPWYPRGTEMRNERQISILCPAELAEIARGLDVPAVEAGWLGANLLLEGLPSLSMIPPRTRLVFASGAVLRVDGQNAPCRYSGRSLATHYPEREGLDLAFVKVAKRLRGLVAWVEKPGRIASGDTVEARIPEQWIYAPNTKA